MRKLAVLCLSIFAISAQATTAEAVIINWTGPSNFDDAAIGFAGFTANSLDLITTSNGIYHDHGSNATWKLDVLLDGSWTNIWSEGPLAGSNQFSLSNITSGGAISFTTGVVTGVRFTVNPNVGVAYHNFNSNNGTQLTFSNVVPEPSSLLMFAGLGLCFGGAAWRKRRKSA